MRRLSRRLLYLVSLVLVLVLLAPAVAYAAPPPLPHSFYGTLIMDGQDAPVGTTVTARVGGVVSGSYTTTVAGWYGNRPTASYLAVTGNINAGDTIRFYVNGVDTTRTATFEIGGGPTELNLSLPVSGATDTSLASTAPSVGSRPVTTPPAPSAQSAPSVPSALTAPARFTLNSLSISPTNAAPGETVTIRLLVANTGGQSANYRVTLKVGGEVEAITEVTVNAGSSKPVSFSTTRKVTGTYSVDVNGLTGSFAVKGAPVVAPAPAPLSRPLAPPSALSAPLAATPGGAATNWPLFGGVIAVSLVMAWLVFSLSRRRPYG